MYPLQFQRILKPKVWGGRSFEKFLHIELPKKERFGESWEVSAHPDGPSFVAYGPWTGRSLPDLLRKKKANLIGRANWKKFGGQFPVLVKYLDIHDKLSVQVHPDDNYALKHNGEYGKSECWFVIKASLDATVILGTKDGIDKKTFLSKIEAKDFTDLFREVPVQDGDFIFIPPGTIHASLRGSLLICEIQQNSNSTYRIYDFDRLENTVPRPLHIKEALEVINFTTRPRMIHKKDRCVSRLGHTHIACLIRDSAFNVDHIELSGAWTEKTGPTFAIFSILEGQGRFVQKEQSWKVCCGETWFLSANMELALEGQLTFLRSWV